MKTNRVLTLITLFGVLAPAALAAQATTTVELPFRTKYMFAGLQFAAAEVQQAHVAVNSGAFTIHGFGVYDFDASDVTEADIYGDYYMQASPMVGVYVGGALYNFKFATGWEGTPELYGGIVLSSVLTPTLHVAHDFDLGDGTRVSLLLAHSVPLGESGASLDFGSTVDYNAEYYTTESGLSFADVSAGVSLPVGPLTVTPMVLIQRHIDDAFELLIPDTELFGVTASMTLGG